MGSLANKAFLGVPPSSTDQENHIRRLASVINTMLLGKLNCTAEVSLKKDAVSTTVSDVRCGPVSVILPMPSTSDGAVALATWHVSNRTDGSFVLTHLSTSTSDCVLTYAIFG